MISAIVLTAFRHAFPLFNFAAAAGMSAIFVRHFYHLLSYNLLLSSMSFALSLLATPSGLPFVHHPDLLLLRVNDLLCELFDL
jgi:hypothetical protein